MHVDPPQGLTVTLYAVSSNPHELGTPANTRVLELLVRLGAQGWQPPSHQKKGYIAGVKWDAAHLRATVELSRPFDRNAPRFRAEDVADLTHEKPVPPPPVNATRSQLEAHAALIAARRTAAR